MNNPGGGPYDNQWNQSGNPNSFPRSTQPYSFAYDNPNTSNPHNYPYQPPSTYGQFSGQFQNPNQSYCPNPQQNYMGAPSAYSTLNLPNPQQNYMAGPSAYSTSNLPNPQQNYMEGPPSHSTSNLSNPQQNYMAGPSAYSTSNPLNTSHLPNPQHNYMGGPSPYSTANLANPQQNYMAGPSAYSTSNLPNPQQNYMGGPPPYSTSNPPNTSNFPNPQQNYMGGPPAYPTSNFPNPQQNYMENPSAYSASSHSQDSYEAWFTSIDVNRSGLISVQELQSALVNSDKRPFDERVCRILVNRFCTHSPDQLNMQDFVRLKQYVSECVTLFSTNSTDRVVLNAGELRTALGYSLSHDYSAFCATVLRNSVKLDQFCLIRKIVMDCWDVFSKWPTQLGTKSRVGYQQYIMDAFSILLI